MIDSAEDWAVFTDPEVFGEVVTWTRGDQVETLSALFTAAHQVAGQGTGPGLSTYAAVLTLGASQLPVTPARQDRITLTKAHPGFAAGTTLAVVDVQPDGSGALRLILERI